jgi:hypothetical protein
MDEFRELLSTYRTNIAGLPRQNSGTLQQVAEVISKILVTHTDAEHWEKISHLRLIASKEVLAAVQGAYDSSSDEEDGEEELVETEEGTGVRKRKPKRPRGATKAKPTQKQKKRKKKAPQAVPLTTGEKGQAAKKACLVRLKRCLVGKRNEILCVQELAYIIILDRSA